MTAPRVAVVMGSDSDWDAMAPASEVLGEFGLDHHVEVVSAHRDAVGMIDFATRAEEGGYEVIIAGAGGAAHLPGMIASVTTLPVVGVPVPRAELDGLDALLSIVQMPAGVPVATMAIGGAANAALFALRILARYEPALAIRLAEHQQGLRNEVAVRNDRLQQRRRSGATGEGTT
jgi:5-(carboxyamino)imidazole ribonucleotide mutase